MVRAYSNDLRERVAASVALGRRCRETADLFGVSVSSVVKWSQRRRSTGTAAALPIGGNRGRSLTAHRPRRLVFIDETWAKTNMAPSDQWRSLPRLCAPAPQSPGTNRRSHLETYRRAHSMLLAPRVRQLSRKIRIRFNLNETDSRNIKSPVEFLSLTFASRFPARLIANVNSLHWVDYSGLDSPGAVSSRKAAANNARV